MGTNGKLFLVFGLLTGTACSQSKGPSALPAESSNIETKDNENESTPYGIYGPGIGGDSLANLTLGGDSGVRKVFMRFRAEQTSALSSILFAFQSADYPGYGGGSGGDWKLELYPDDGSNHHFPGGLPLAVEYIAAYGITSNSRQIVFSNPAQVVKGSLYHLVYENIDLDPERNFFSTDNWARLSFTEGGELNPRFLDRDWATGYYFNGSWHIKKGFAPILEIAYENGEGQGMSYAEASFFCPIDPPQPGCVNQQLVGEINGAEKMAREMFTVSGGEKTVFGAGVRLLRTLDTISDLKVSLCDRLGDELDSFVIPAASVATGPGPDFTPPISWDDVGQKARWVSGTFGQSWTLLDGQTYYLKLSSSGGTYWAWVNRKLKTGYLFTPVSYFEDGWAEYTTDGVSWSPLGRVAEESDLQFYLMVLEAP